MGNIGAIRLRTTVWGAVLGSALLSLSIAPAYSAVQVTSGDFHAFAGGAGRDISGNATMVRRADGTTFVRIHLQGLAGGATYASHVHKLPCGTSDADGHFQQGGEWAPYGAAEPNEIWPGHGSITSTLGGVVNANSTVPYTANGDAVSVVVHDSALPSTANKIACADLS